MEGDNSKSSMINNPIKLNNKKRNLIQILNTSRVDSVGSKQDIDPGKLPTIAVVQLEE
jgi:hypothetical protein